MNRSSLLAILILITTACSPQRARLDAPAAQQAAVAVQTETVATSEITDIYRASGTVRACYTAAIAAKIAANILEVQVQTGERVHAGQTLIVLDRRDLEAHLRRSEAARAEVERAITESEDAIAAARSNFELARVTYKRFQDLLAKASASRQEFDESEARLESAEAAHEMAVAKRRQVEARRNQVEAEIAAARVDLDYATLAAPFPGLVTERKADPGSLATPGTTLLTVEREGNLRLEASIDESRLGLARIG
jgi:multidrug resistance efflux pump